MNSTHIRNALFFALALLVFGCATKKDGSDSEAGDQKLWKEMDEYHMIMAETFHPYKDSANLEPAKSRAGELAAAAEKWASSPLPEKVDNDEMRNNLAQLVRESSALVQIANSEDESAIGNQLTKVHDLFHAIQEAWYGGGEEHNH
jgi:hypothetical protein